MHVYTYTHDQLQYNSKKKSPCSWQKAFLMRDYITSFASVGHQILFIHIDRWVSFRKFDSENSGPTVTSSCINYTIEREHFDH